MRNRLVASLFGPNAVVNLRRLKEELAVAIGSRFLHEMRDLL